MLPKTSHITSFGTQPISIGLYPSLKNVSEKSIKTEVTSVCTLAATVITIGMETHKAKSKIKEVIIITMPKVGTINILYTNDSGFH